MQITALVRAKKSQKVNIYIDGQYSFSVLEYIVIRENLFKGQLLTQDEISKILEKSNERYHFEKCIEYISRRPRSEKEIEKYLIKKLYKQENKDVVVSNIISMLLENKYIDDRAFTDWWVDNRQKFSKKSKREISQELRAKGVDMLIVDDVLNEKWNLEEEQELIKKLITKQTKKYLLKKNISSTEINLKVKKYLLSKGFSWEQINNLI